MELKLKEGVDLSLLTTQYRIESIALELLEGEETPTEREIRLKVMISVANFLTDGQVFKLIENKKDVDLYNVIVNDIEPLYIKYLNEHQDCLDIVESIVQSIKEHHVTLLQKNNSVIGFLNLLFQEIRNLNPEEIDKFKETVNDIELTHQKNKAEKRLDETKAKFANDKTKDVNQKLEQLIESYTEKNDK
jgi:hypothetical protein